MSGSTGAPDILSDVPAAEAKPTQESGPEDEAEAEAEDPEEQLFLQKCPPGVVLTSFYVNRIGGLEDIEIQRFFGPRDDVANEFDTDFELEVRIEGTRDGEPFSIGIEIDIYQNMDVGTDKVYFEEEFRNAYVDFPLEFKDAVSSLCAGIPQVALGAIDAYIETLERS